ncbi:hemagglutinin/hemolysin-like protein [Haemophilus parainfluenzae]|uniref:Hemagglutinin/hemolysin-like protein n=1 Tax=Haemophilus parainfluenzae TaxID=729 RepID=A0A377JEX0_HAEPA|nr:hemagglutinin/hemolysin-like protein [Haemophilus parainfluenzae]
MKSVERVGQSKNDRVNAMAATNSAMDAYRARQEAMKNRNMDSVVGLQITYGQQKSESRMHTEGKTAAKSQVNAGDKVNIVATGAGKASNITINGSDVSGKQGTFLGQRTTSTSRQPNKRTKSATPINRVVLMQELLLKLAVV